METNERILHLLFGAFAGCLATVILGFWLGGWMTHGGSERASIDAVRSEVTKVLVPHCVDQAVHDPEFPTILAQIEGTSAHIRTKILIQAGWATLLPATDPDLVIANACMERLMSDFGGKVLKGPLL